MLALDICPMIEDWDERSLDDLGRLGGSSGTRAGPCQRLQLKSMTSLLRQVNDGISTAEI
jgi:hypothetical protein